MPDTPAAFTLHEAEALKDEARQLLDHFDDTGDPALVVHTLADIREAVGHLKDVEADLVRAMGLKATATHLAWQGETGAYLWEVHGGKTRKEWDHEGWKKAVRQAVVDKALDDLHLPKSVMVVTDDGELTPLDLAAPLYHVALETQAVHGSAEPKVTALRPLDIDRDDYCRTYPGPYTITITPAITEETTDA